MLLIKTRVNLSKVIGIIAVVLVCVTFLSAYSLSADIVSAEESVVDRVILDIPDSCTMSANIETGEEHEANLMTSTYTEDIGTTTFTTFCNDLQGYAIYAVGHSDDTYGNTQMISDDANVSNIVTGTSTSGDVSNWAMKLASVSGTYAPTIHSDTSGSYSAYHIVPNAYTKVASFPSVTSYATGSQGSQMESTYAVYISPSQGAATYIGKVRYTLVHPSGSAAPPAPITCAASKICYAPDATGVTDTMGDQTVSSNATATLWASNFQRPGYGFAGWNTEYDYSGDYYGPNELISIGDVSTAGIPLYAVWVKSAGYFQTWSGCGSMSIRDVTALTDVRDNNTYAIAKLADGHCWMIENLRLDNTAELSADNTDHPSLPLTNDGTLGTTSNHLSASSNSWCYSSAESCLNQSLINADNTANPVANMTTANTNVYSYGNYYNWYSATAGTGTYSVGTNNTSVNGSICPSGWVLPRGGDINNALNSDYYKLGVAITGEAPELNPSNNRYWYTYSNGDNNPFRVYPNNFTYVGLYNADTNTISTRGASSTYYITATAGSGSMRYSAAYGSTSFYPGTFTNSKTHGFVVRCLQDYVGR